MAPGEIELTRTLDSPSSIATHLVRMDHRRLGRTIDHRGRETGETASDAAVVDDAAKTLLLHVGRGVLHAEHDAAHQGRHRRVEALDLEGFDATGLRRAAGIVEQAVDAAEFVHREPDQRLHLRFDRHIRLAEDASRPELLRQRLAFRYTPARDHNFGTFGNEDFRSPQPDPARRARDHRDLAIQPAHGMSLFSNLLNPNGGHRSIPAPRHSAPQQALFLPASDKASFACAGGMRNIPGDRSIVARISQPDCAWGS
ncbi:hypothetical protein ACVWW4_004916 [Bradyrhizobium sp. LB7.1]